MRLLFRNPMGKIEENPKLEFLHEIIVDPPIGYWEQGGRGGNLDYLTDISKTSLMICPSPEHGISLRHYDEQRNPWLSVHEKEKLMQCIELYDEWYASVGLFLPKEKAWLAVQEFCLTGKRSSHVQWLPSSEIPEGGNW